jgi:hypothetical protein
MGWRLTERQNSQRDIFHAVRYLIGEEATSRKMIVRKRRVKHASGIPKVLSSAQTHCAVGGNRGYFHGAPGFRRFRKGFKRFQYRIIGADAHVSLHHAVR